MGKSKRACANHENPPQTNDYDFCKFFI
jgi:hypothetical protein